MKTKIFLILLSVFSLTKNIITATDPISLVNIDVSEGSMMQCHMRCSTMTECTAYTIQKTEKNSARSESNVCKLQRYYKSSDSEDDISIHEEDDMTMVMIPGPIVRSLRMEWPKPPTISSDLKEIGKPKLTDLKNYQISSIDDLGTKFYIIFWADSQTKNTKPPMFTVVNKNNIQTSISTFKVSAIFKGFTGPRIRVAFTLNNRMYLYIVDSWCSYDITFDNSGAITPGIKKNGGVSSLIKYPASGTVIGNDAVLFTYVDGTVRCVSAKALNSQKLATPAPNQQCQNIASFVRKQNFLNPTTAIAGYDNSTLIFYSHDKIIAINKL